MSATLPRPIGRKAAVFAGFLMLACSHPQAPVAAGEPIPAEPDVDVDTADKECDGLVTQLEKYGDCPNADDADKAWAKQVVELAQSSFEASKKSKPNEEAQKVIAHACHRAALSIHHATLRCAAGKRPPPSY